MIESPRWMTEMGPKEVPEPSEDEKDSDRQAKNMFDTLKSDHDSVVYSGSNAIDANKVLKRLKSFIQSNGEDFESNYDVSNQNINEGMFTVSRKKNNEQTPDDNESLDKAA